jgi:hypothetical protein
MLFIPCNVDKIFTTLNNTLLFIKGGKFLDLFSDCLLVDECSARRNSMEDLPGLIRQSTSANHSVISFAVISIPNDFVLREGRSTHPRH